MFFMVPPTCEAATLRKIEEGKAAEQPRQSDSGGIQKDTFLKSRRESKEK
jgi:hypothetical protein